MANFKWKYIIISPILITPSIIGAEDWCYRPVNSCAGCGGLDDMGDCDDHYDPTTSGGRKWGSGVVSPKICRIYSPGDHTTTPCEEEPPFGFTRTSCPGDSNGDCCDVRTGSSVGNVVTGTITKPNGLTCLGSGGQG